MGVGVGVADGISVAVGGIRVAVGSVVEVGSLVGVDEGGIDVVVGIIIGVGVGDEVGVESGMGVDVEGIGVVVFTTSTTFFARPVSTVASISGKACCLAQPTTHNNKTTYINILFMPG